MTIDNRTRARSFRDFISVSALLYVFATIIVMGTVVAAGMLWPATPAFGYEWRLSAYLPSLGGFAAGAVVSILFAALGKTLADLSKLVRNLDG